MTRRAILFAIVAAFLSSASFATDITLRDFNVYLGAGDSMHNRHGHSSFRSVLFEVAGDSPFASRHLRGPSEVGATLTYSDIDQPQSWFGDTYGDGHDKVRGYTSFFFARRHWREHSSVQPYFEMGGGPFFANRRVPAATSRINFASSGGFGLTFLKGRSPLMIGYRFQHISNGGLTSRNPGINVHSFLVGTRLRSIHR